MSCPYPWNIYDKKTHTVIGQAPCGHCASCIVDKRNTIEDLCSEELFQRNYVASYITLTYDDNHLDWRDDWHGHIVPSIKSSDATRFIKRLRKYMDDKKIDTPLLQRNFRYIVAGEYGGETFRPHLHFVLFGIDYRACRKLISSVWKWGNIKILPVENGCFRYLADYMNKQVYSIDKHNTYFVRNMEKPFFHHSKSIGKSLFLRQREFILSHDFCYKSRNGRLRPLPVYYMRRYCLIRSDSHIDEKKSKWRQYFPNKDFSLTEYNKFLHKLSIVRNDNLISKLVNSNKSIPCSDVPSWWKSQYKSNAVCDIAIKNYISSIHVTNQFVLDTLNNEKFLPFKAVFINGSNAFVQSTVFPSYKNLRQVAYDLAKYGNLLPF